MTWVGAVTAVAIAAGSLALTLGLLPRPPLQARTPLTPPRWDLPARAACTAAAVVTVTAVATTLGPHLSGLITAYLLARDPSGVMQALNEMLRR